MLTIKHLSGGGTDYVTPNVCLVRGNDYCHYQPYIPIPISIGDIAYWDGSSVKTTPLSSWNSSLGTPVGVVMIGEGFAPDGKVRIISLTSMDNGGYLKWDTSSYHDTTDSPVSNFKFVPTTDNAGSTSTGSNTSGYLPSDRIDFSWSGAQSYVDTLAKYRNGTSVPMIPSPYLGEEFNPTYSGVIDGGNVLSDFNGLSNTQLLVNEGTRYAAANACWNYKDATNGADGLQWYLPAMGELGFLMVRFELINQSIQAVGGTPVENMYFWSSSEYVNGGNLRAYLLNTINGSVGLNYNKYYKNLVRALTLV